MKKMIIYEKLNIMTLLISGLCYPIIGKQYFVDYSWLVKKYFYYLVKILKLRQLTVLDILGKGYQVERSKILLDITEKIINENNYMSNALIKYGKDLKYLYVHKKNLIESLLKKTTTYIFTKKLTEDKKYFDWNIYILNTNINYIFHHMDYKLKNVKLVKVHYPLLKFMKMVSRVIYFIILSILPGYMVFKIIVGKNLTLKKDGRKKIKKDILFIHNQKELFIGSETRDMYMFRSNILKIKNCVHTIIKGVFSQEKAKYLVKNNGQILDYNNCSISYKYIFKRLFIDYLVFLFDVKHILLDKYVNYTFIKSYLFTLRSIWISENFIERLKVKLIIFENDTPNYNAIISIIANLHNIKTMTMPHGIGAFMFPYYRRANRIYNYYLVSGDSYKYYEVKNNPGIDVFHKIGIHEIDDSNTDMHVNDFNKIKLNKKNKKIISVFAHFYYPFFVEHHKWNLSNPLFFDVTENKFNQYWMPFFEWAGENEKLFFVFKAKPNRNQYQHPYVINALNLIPKDRYLINDDLDIFSLINVSDLTINTANSSIEFASLCMKTPSVSLDLFYNGYNSKHNYSNNHIVSNNPNDLISNIEYVLQNNFTKDFYQNVKNDHHPFNKLDDNDCEERIRSLINTIIGNTSSSIIQNTYN